jgi:hypothetical protein
MADQLEERANSGKYRRVADLAMHSVASQAHQQAHRLAVQTEGSAANQLEVRRSARHSEVVHQLVMHPEEVLEALGAMAMVDLLEGLAGRSEVDSKYLVVEKATLRGDLAVHPRVVRGLQEEDQWASRLANWLAECYLATRPEDLLGGPKEVLREDRLTGGKVVLRMAANWWVGLLATQSASRVAAHLLAMRSMAKPTEAQQEDPLGDLAIATNPSATLSDGLSASQWVDRRIVHSMEARTEARTEAQQEEPRGGLAIEKDRWVDLLVDWMAVHLTVGLLGYLAMQRGALQEDLAMLQLVVHQVGAHLGPQLAIR